MNDWSNELLAAPAYSPADAARILSINYTTLMYWIAGRMTKTTRRYYPALIKLATHNPPELSFVNLIECHVLKALTVRYKMRMENVRNGLDTLKQRFNSEHPLLDERFQTEGLYLFVDEAGQLLNISKGGQLAFRDIMEVYLQRVVWSAAGLVKYYPFVYKERANEPKIISMTPMISFGQSVIDGTGISTAVIASRFAAREDPEALAEEYGRTKDEIWEAIRWEGEYRKAAA